MTETDLRHSSSICSSSLPIPIFISSLRELSAHWKAGMLKFSLFWPPSITSITYVFCSARVCNHVVHVCTYHSIKNHIYSMYVCDENSIQSCMHTKRSIYNNFDLYQMYIHEIIRPRDPQSNTTATHPRQSFSKKSELHQVGLESTTFCVLGRCSTN